MQSNKLRFEVTETRGTGFTEVTVHLGEESVAFSTKVYSKVRPNHPNGAFYELNEFLKTLEEKEAGNIFNSYKNIRELYDMDFEPTHIANALGNEVKGIYNNIDLNQVRRWLNTIGNLFIPPDIEKAITADSRYTNRDQTYTIEDYTDLATFALAVRLATPVLGEYMDQTTEQELYKETEAAALLVDTTLAHWPFGHYYADTNEERPSVMEKLSNYITFCTSDKSTTLGNLWGGMAGVDIPIHLKAKVIVRRLTILSLNDHTVNHSMVSNIFRYVKSNAEPTERTSSEAVKDKYGGAVSEEDDRKSFLEEYKTKQRVSAGDIVAFNLDALDYKLLATKVDESIDLKKLEACMITMETVSEFEISPHQVFLAQWVMAKSFPSRAFYHVDKKAINHLVAAAQALMWHWGYADLAVFMQVEPIYNNNTGSTNQLGQRKMGTRIAGRHKSDLDDYYPHMRKGRITNRGIQNAHENMAANAISTVSSALRSSDWIYRGPDRLYLESEQDSPKRVLIVPVNNKHRLTEMVIHLCTINN